jgi:hypothetical protein
MSIDRKCATSTSSYLQKTLAAYNTMRGHGKELERSGDADARAADYFEWDGVLDEGSQSGPTV